MNNKCCRFCHYFNIQTSCCNHEPMFEVKDHESGYDVVALEFVTCNKSKTIDNLDFKIKRPREFSCRYFE